MNTKLTYCKEKEKDFVAGVKLSPRKRRKNLLERIEKAIYRSDFLLERKMWPEETRDPDLYCSLLDGPPARQSFLLES